MSHTYQQYKLNFGPKNPISLAFAGQYFVSLFSEHPVVGHNFRSSHVVTFHNSSDSLSVTF